jgi:hypothetical protein
VERGGLSRLTGLPQPNQHDTFDWAFTIEIRVE